MSALRVARDASVDVLQRSPKGTRFFMLARCLTVAPPGGDSQSVDPGDDGGPARALRTRRLRSSWAAGGSQRSRRPGGPFLHLRRRVARP
jgi:hypothetical protein